MTKANTERAVLRIGGAGAFKFLQDLMTNDVTLAHNGWCYSAILTPQGKFLVDFFVTLRDGCYLIDAPKDHAQNLSARLNLYKLRSPITIEMTDLQIQRGLEHMPNDAAPDPRHPKLPWRQLSTTPSQALDDLALRVAYCVPQIDAELQVNESYILEYGFARLNGVDFAKGCYVGQEVTARMHHKTELRKGLTQVEIDGQAPLGTAITRDNKTVGTLYSQYENRALAYLRFDRMGAGMTAGDAVLNLCEPT